MDDGRVESEDQPTAIGMGDLMPEADTPGEVGTGNRVNPYRVRSPVTVYRPTPQDFETSPEKENNPDCEDLNLGPKAGCA